MTEIQPLKVNSSIEPMDNAPEIHLRFNFDKAMQREEQKKLIRKSQQKGTDCHDCLSNQAICRQKKCCCCCGDLGNCVLFIGVTSFFVLLASLAYGAIFFTELRTEKRTLMVKEIKDEELLLYSWRLFDITHLIYFALSILSTLLFVFSFAIGYYFRYHSARWIMYYTFLLSMICFAAFYTALAILKAEEIPGLTVSMTDKLDYKITYASHAFALVVVDGWILSLIGSWVNQFQSQL